MNLFSLRYDLWCENERKKATCSIRFDIFLQVLVSHGVRQKHKNYYFMAMKSAACEKKSRNPSFSWRIGSTYEINGRAFVLWIKCDLVCEFVCSKLFCD